LFLQTEALTMKRLFSTLAVSLSQPSAWRGILFIGTSIGLVLNPELQNAIVAAGMALAGLVGVLVPDSSGSNTTAGE
jgi:hypothetical protein